MSDEGENRHNLCEDIAPYLLGALRPAVVDAFERHLTQCPSCLDICDDLGPVVAGLAALTEAEVGELLATRALAEADRRRSPPGEPRPPGSGHRPPEFVAPSREKKIGSGGSDRSPIRASGPARFDGSPSGDDQWPCPFTLTRLRLGRSRLRAATIGALAVLGVCVAVGSDSCRAAAALRVTPVTPVALPPSGANPSRVTATAGPQRQDGLVRVTVAGFGPPEVPCRAVPDDGRTHPSGGWAGGHDGRRSRPDPPLAPEMILRLAVPSGDSATMSVAWLRRAPVTTGTPLVHRP